MASGCATAPSVTPPGASVYMLPQVACAASLSRQFARARGQRAPRRGHDASAPRVGRAHLVRLELERGKLLAHALLRADLLHL